MMVELREARRVGYAVAWQELWIDGKFHYGSPGRADANTVAHILCREMGLRGLPATYRLCLLSDVKKEA